MSTTSPEPFTDRLIAFIAAEVVSTDDPVGPDTDLLLTGLVDSIGVLLVVNWIEDDLMIAIDPADVVLENFQTVGHMIEYIRRSEGVTSS